MERPHREQVTVGLVLQLATGPRRPHTESATTRASGRSRPGRPQMTTPNGTAPSGAGNRRPGSAAGRRPTKATHRISDHQSLWTIQAGTPADDNTQWNGPIGSR